MLAALVSANDVITSHVTVGLAVTLSCSADVNDDAEVRVINNHVIKIASFDWSLLLFIPLLIVWLLMVHKSV